MEQFLINIEKQYENDEYQDEDSHFMQSIAV